MKWGNLVAKSKSRKHISGTPSSQSQAQSNRHEEQENKVRNAELAKQEQNIQKSKEELESVYRELETREEALTNREKKLMEKESELEKERDNLKFWKDELEQKQLGLEREKAELANEKGFIQKRVEEAKTAAVEEIRSQEQKLRDEYDQNREEEWNRHYDTLMQKEKDDAQKIRAQADEDSRSIREQTEQERQTFARQTQAECNRLMQETKTACAQLKDEAHNWCVEQHEKVEAACEERLKQARVYCENLRQKAATEREAAREAYDDAYREADEKQKQLQEEIHAQRERLQQEFLKKNKEITEREGKLQAEREAFAIEQETLEAETECTKEIQENYRNRKEKFSPAVVEKLNEELVYVNSKLDTLREVNAKQEERIELLSRYQKDADGTSTEELLRQNDELRRENEMFSDRIAGYPSESEIKMLRQKAKTLESIDDELHDERTRRVLLEERVARSQLDVNEIENQKTLVASYMAMNDQLRAAIDRNTALYKQNVMSKFQGLLAIDRIMEHTSAYQGERMNKTLKEIVDYVRDYGAAWGDGTTKLYYSESQIRTFIASMAASHLIILQGLSGTGKSSLPRLFAKALHFSNDLIPVQSSWNDNRELLGYDNDFTKKFKETEFTKAVYQASLPKNKDRVSLLILDEMNLARIEYYFADFLAVMEKNPEDWYVSLVSSNEDEEKPEGLKEGTQLHITPNIWFIGTANQDESTMGITDKVYDRALVMNFERHAAAFSATCGQSLEFSFSQFSSMLEEAVNNTQFCMSEDDWFTIDILDEEMKEKLDITFGNRIRKQMERFVPVYCACGGTKGEAIDYLLCRKLLRKLDERFEPYIMPDLKELKGSIIANYGEENMPKSIAYLDKIIKRLSGGSDNV